TGCPSPSWGGVRGGGKPRGGQIATAIPPTLSLPHEGGGDPGASAALIVGAGASFQRKRTIGRLQQLRTRPGRGEAVADGGEVARAAALQGEAGHGARKIGRVAQGASQVLAQRFAVMKEADG